MAQRRVWTSEEDDHLRKLIDGGASVEVAAVKLGRSIGATKARTGLLKISRKRFTVRPRVFGGAD